MRLTQLTITNFGIYKNENTFTFPYSKNKNISVIIGKNGAGKTTFLNAIKVCLFGPMMLKNKTITKNYESYITDKLNKDALKEELSYFSIKATFISQLINYDGEFTIERIWDIKNGFSEKVYMLKDNQELTFDEQASFFNAFYHAFPLDLFELFYLDGEKIDQLSVLNSNIVSLIESSINLDLFNKLQNDLLTYAAKRINTKESNELFEQRQRNIDESNNLSISIESSITKIEDLQKEIDIKNEEIITLKNSVHSEILNSEQDEKKIIEQNILDLKRDIETDLTSYLPYTLVANQLKNLLTQLTDEEKANSGKTVINALNSNELNEFLKQNNTISDATATLELIKNFYDKEEDDIVHNLSTNDYHILSTKISNLMKFDKESLREKVKTLNKYENRLLEIEKKNAELESIKAAGLLDELLILQSEYDALIIQFNQLSDSLLQNEERNTQLEAELKAIESALWTQLKTNNITNVINSIHFVLDDYIREIKRKKVIEIEKHTKEMFDLLIRKKGFIDNFTIEDDTISLMDLNGNKLNHSNLSAGEKQLFVLSLIYAILQSSERRVPLMFDTLLGRLDEEHRDNVFKKFISSCPDQVIILATDSELVNVDQDYLSSIKNIEYIIDFSNIENQISTVRA